MTGHYLHLVEKRDAVLSGARISPAARARILGKTVYRMPAKEHRIVVDMKAATRTVETTDYAAPKKAKRKDLRRRRLQSKYADIMEAVAAAFNVTLNALFGEVKKSDAATSRARFAVMRMIREERGASTPCIGRAIKRDHTTVLSGLKRADQLIGTDRDWANRYHDARERVKGGE